MRKADICIRGHKRVEGNLDKHSSCLMCQKERRRAITGIPIESFDPANYVRMCLECGEQIELSKVVRGSFRKTTEVKYCSISCGVKASGKRIKIEIFSWYGTVCVCCGLSDLCFLTLDHVNDDGTREYVYGVNCAAGVHHYKRLRKAGFENRPRDLQVLCWNCQWGKKLHNGFCPHNPDRDLRILPSLLIDATVESKLETSSNTMKTAPPVTTIPGKMIPTQGPYVAGVGAIPAQTKSHNLPVRKETRGDKMMENQGPSKANMGAIPSKTRSHNVPSQPETVGGMQAGGMMPPNMLSGHDRMSPANADVHKSWKNKGKYSMSNQDA